MNLIQVQESVDQALLSLIAKQTLLELANKVVCSDDSRILLLSELQTPISGFADLEMIDLRTQSCGNFVEIVTHEYRRQEKQDQCKERWS